jgi:hypothetical protein
MSSTKSKPRFTVKPEQAKAELEAQAAGIDPEQARREARRAKDKARREAKKAAQEPTEEPTEEQPKTPLTLDAKIAKAIAKAASAQDGKPVPVATGVYVAGNGNFLLERVGDSKAWTACGILTTESGLRFGSKIEHPTSRAALRSLTVAS